MAAPGPFAPRLVSAAATKWARRAVLFLLLRLTEPRVAAALLLKHPSVYSMSQSHAVPCVRKCV